jgi:nitrogen-specific signal transduction histidine kinase
MANSVSRAVIEVLLDRVHQGAITLSPAGHLSYANQRFASMMGMSRAQLVGKPLAELVAEPDRDALAEALAAGRDSAAQCRLSLPRSNGHGPIPALLLIAPLGHGQASCLVTDLSQGQHIGVLTHEVRNMLGAVRDAVEALKHASLESDPQRAVEAIERQSARILELMEDLRRVNPKE